MTRRRITRLLGFVGVALAASTGCWRKPTDEERIHRVIQDIVAGAVDGDVGDVMAHVSKKYQADSVDYPALHGLLVEAFLRRGPILVVPGPIAVKVVGDTAHASFDAAIAEGSAIAGAVVAGEAGKDRLDVALAVLARAAPVAAQLVRFAHRVQ